ncbi:hypothetical protein V2O64_18645 [Verrucomicrobiaceae bacterium 227]
MKKASYAPLLVFIGCGSWLAWQQIQIQQLKNLRSTSIAESSDSGPSQAPAVALDAPYSYLNPSGKPDLDMIFAATNGDLTLDGKTIHGLRAKIRLDLELKKMTPAELLELAEIATKLDSSNDERLSLLRKIYGKLAVDSPHDAIRLMSENIDENFYLITRALSTLSSESPLEVAAWIDQHEEQLRSDSKSLSSHQSRILKIEEELAPHLLKTDPDALHARIQKLTPAEATILLNKLSQGNKETDYLKSVVKLARRSRQSEAIARNLAFTFPKDDLSAATGLINEFNFIDSERNAFILQTATNLGAKESTDLSHLNKLYDWIQTQSTDTDAPMHRAFATSYAMNDDNPGQYERTVAKIVELGGASTSNNMLKLFADETVCIPTCHDSITNRLGSIESPALKKALADAHQIVSQQNPKDSHR